MRESKVTGSKYLGIFEVNKFNYQKVFKGMFSEWVPLVITPIIFDRIHATKYNVEVEES